MALQGPIGRANAARRVDDFQFMPDPTFLKVVAGAHQSSAADLVWLSALPNMSKQFDDKERVARKRKWLEAVLNTITEVEPSWYTPYEYGSHYVTLGLRDHEFAIEILQKGVARNPDHTNLLRLLGLQYFDTGDHKSALHYLERAASQPDCDLLTMAQVDAMRVRGGSDAVALARWIPMLEHKNKLFAELAERNLENIKKQIVIRAKKEYEVRHGAPPTSLDDLREEGLIDPSVVDPVLAGATLDAEGKLDFPRLSELNLRNTLRASSRWCMAFRNEAGRDATLEDVMGGIGNPGRPPKGKRWALINGPEGKELVVEDAEE
jgi:tetratricopeptide (TPR) repeat protein